MTKPKRRRSTVQTPLDIFLQRNQRVPLAIRGGRKVPSPSASRRVIRRRRSHGSGRINSGGRIARGYAAAAVACQDLIEEGNLRPHPRRRQLHLAVRHTLQHLRQLLDSKELSSCALSQQLQDHPRACLHGRVHAPPMVSSTNPPLTRKIGQSAHGGGGRRRSEPPTKTRNRPREVLRSPTTRRRLINRKRVLSSNRSYTGYPLTVRSGPSPMPTIFSISSRQIKKFHVREATTFHAFRSRSPGTR